jgi:hypothetical protein
MTSEEHTLLLIRGHIASLPKELQAKIETAAIKLREGLTAGGDAAAMALALVGAELAAKR